MHKALLLSAAALGLAVMVCGSDPAQARQVGCAACNGFSPDARQLVGQRTVVDVELAKLDDPRNPYSTEYEPWDLWIYEHAVTASDARVQRYYREEGRRGNTVLSAYVDGNGYLVPQRVAESRQLHAWAEGDRPKEYPYPWTHVMIGAGPIDAALLESYEKSMLALRAQYCLPVPGWLAELKPAWALQLPPDAGKAAGEVIVYARPGTLPGLTLSPGAVRPPHTREVFFRYSAEGELITQTKAGEQWWEMYLPNPEKGGATGADPLLRAFESNGIITVTNLRDNTVAWISDLSGQHFEQHITPPARNATHWRGLTGTELQYIYALQQGTAKAPPKQRARPKVAPGKEPARTPPPMGGQR